MAGPAPSAGGPWRALRSRNYRLFFAGQSISLVGTWLTRVATSWLVFRLTHSAWLLGLVGFAGQLPTLLLAPVAGVLVDRLSRHKLLVLTQALAMLQSLALAALALAHAITVWEVAALSAFQGVINAFDTPARQAFVVEMVDRRDELPSAIALNSSMVNVARLLGPSIGGALIASVGEGLCFLLDGVSYLAVIASLLLMRVKPLAAAGPRPHPLRALEEGFRYAFGFAPIRALLLLLALVSLLGFPYMVLMPVVAAQTLHGGPHTLGLLMGASGLGALVGLFYLASRRSVLGLGRVVWRSAALFGLSLVGFAASHGLVLSLLLLLGVGAGMMVQMASTNTLLQTLVDEDKRGRVMAFYTMAFIGMAPLGSLFAGALAQRLGVSWTLALGGLLCVGAAVAFRSLLPRLRPHVVPIYQRLGILPQMAEL